MFQSLTDRLTGIFSGLRHKGALSETDVGIALREIRIALLEADVALPVVKKFIADVKERAVGQEVIRSIQPGQMVIKIVNDHLIEMLGGEAEPLNLNAPSPVPIMMVGLQGSGKTTTTAKLALRLKEKQKKKVLMASLDVYRPAAQHQLATLGEQLDISTLEIVEGQSPQEITKRALEVARRQAFDIVLLDTAGRLHIDDVLMNELKEVKALSNPIETLFVADSMTGQDAVNIAKAFQDQIGITGVVLTRIDGDAKGGAALSIRGVTGCPIKFVGFGEKPHQFDTFDPPRIADRILDRGDIVALVEKAAETVDQEEAAKMAEKMQQGSFDLDDMAKQLEQMLKMGGMSTLMTMLPGMGKLKDKINDAGLNDKLLRRQIAIIHSMTPQERRAYKILNGSRRRRIAFGCGLQVQDVNKLIKQYEQMRDVMKKMKKFGGKGMLSRLGGIKDLLSSR